MNGGRESPNITVNSFAPTLEQTTIKARISRTLLTLSLQNIERRSLYTSIE